MNGRHSFPSSVNNYALGVPKVYPDISRTDMTMTRKRIFISSVQKEFAQVRRDLRSTCFPNTELLLTSTGTRRDGQIGLQTPSITP